MKKVKLALFLSFFSISMPGGNGSKFEESSASEYLFNNGVPLTSNDWGHPQYFEKRDFMKTNSAHLVRQWFMLKKATGEIQELPCGCKNIELSERTFIKSFNNIYCYSRLLNLFKSERILLFCKNHDFQFDLEKLNGSFSDQLEVEKFKDKLREYAIWVQEQKERCIKRLPEGS